VLKLQKKKKRKLGFGRGGKRFRVFLDLAMSFLCVRKKKRARLRRGRGGRGSKIKQK
jgi:hypothetical protein